MKLSTLAIIVMAVSVIELILAATTGKMNLFVGCVGWASTLISQFTLYMVYRKQEK